MPLFRVLSDSWGCPFTIGLGRLALKERFWRDENASHLTAPLARHWRATKMVASLKAFWYYNLVVGKSLPALSW